MTDADARWALRRARSRAGLMTSNYADAEDVAQEAMLGLVRADARFDPARCDCWRAWATTILSWRLIDALREMRFCGLNHKRHRPRLLSLVVPPASRAVDTHDRDDAMHRVLKACRSDRDRHIVEMRASGMIGREIAAVLEICKETVSQDVGRVRRRFEKGGAA